MIVVVMLLHHDQAGMMVCCGGGEEPVVVLLGCVDKAGGHEDGNGDTEDPEEDVHPHLQGGGRLMGMQAEAVAAAGRGSAIIRRLAAGVVGGRRPIRRPTVCIIPTVVVTQGNIRENLAQIAHIDTLHATHPMVVVAVGADAVHTMLLSPVLLLLLLLLPLFPVPLAAVVRRRRLAVVVVVVVVNLEDVVVVVVVALPLGGVQVDVDVDGSDGERLHVFVVAVVRQLQRYSQQVTLTAPHSNHSATGLNMELDLQSLFGLQCTLCPRNSPPPPHLGSCTRALVVSQDRRHLFVTPCSASKKVSK